MPDIRRMDNNLKKTHKYEINIEKGTKLRCRQSLTKTDELL